SGASGAARQGSSVALSADGLTALVGGTSDNNAVGATWVFVQPPGLTNISPNFGPVDGGTGVTVVGSHLGGINAVTLCGTAGTNSVPLDSKTALVTTPPHAAGAADVVVPTPHGNAVLAGAFTYVARATNTLLGTSLSPSQLGQSVTFTAIVVGGGAIAPT